MDYMTGMTKKAMTTARKMARMTRGQHVNLIYIYIYLNFPPLVSIFINIFLCGEFFFKTIIFC